MSKVKVAFCAINDKQFQRKHFKQKFIMLIHLRPLTSVHPEAALYLTNAVSVELSATLRQRQSYSCRAVSCSEYMGAAGCS